MLNSDRKTIASGVIWWFAAFGLILLTHLGVETIAYYFLNSSIKEIFNPILYEKEGLVFVNIVMPARGILFVFSFGVLIHPIVAGVINQNLIQENSQTLFKAIIVTIILCIIFTPGQLSGLAEEYSNTSLVMFSRQSSVSYSRRFLMPAIAHALFFRGDFFFRVFSFILAFIFIFFILKWFEKNNIKVSLWQVISLGTLSFVYFHFQVPGYPDVLVFIFIILAFLFSDNTTIKMSLFVLSLATHEACIVIWAGLAFILFNKREATGFIIVSALHVLMFIATTDDVFNSVALRGVGENSNISWIIDYPERELLGILLSFKGLWLMIVGAIWHSFSQKNIKQVLQILVILFTGITMTFLGVDISRLFGWTFMVILISWNILSSANSSRLINTSLIINFLIPSVNVLLIMNPYFAFGIYSYIYHFLGGS